MTGLVLSLFPGIGLLDMAFEEEGYCVVRGPDVLWGGDVRRFHPPAGVFEGVIGGPPCQSFSSLSRLVRQDGREPSHGNLIPEYERVVGEARPAWFLMENVKEAPLPVVPGYLVHAMRLNNRWVAGSDESTGAEQNRVRRFSFGTHDGRELSPDVALFEAPATYLAVTTGYGKGSRERMKRQVPLAVTSAHGGNGRGNIRNLARYTVPEAARLQGLPDDFLADAPFLEREKLRVIANGVPLPMGRAIARAVSRAMQREGVAS